MPRKQSDALPSEKMLVLYQRLTLDAGRHYQSVIANDLGCSTQRIPPMIQIIERHIGKGAYIHSGLDGRRRYYQLRTKAAETALGFSFEELRYLSICRDLAAPMLPEGVADRIDRSLTALALHLGEANGHSLSGAPIGFRNKGFIDYGPHLGTIAALRQAIEKRQVCRVVYRASGRSVESEYRYAPGRILAMSGTLYVQGYRLPEGSLLKERPTTFSVHRISDVAPTGEYFRFDAADAEARSFGLNWHPPKRIQVHIASQAADYVRDRVWSDDQAVDEHPDGSLTLSVTTTSEKELNAWVMGFGELANITSDGV